MRTVLRHLRFAWLEYQDTRDGAVFAHSAVARLGFENALASLPKAKGSHTKREASNAGASKFTVKTFKSGSKKFNGLIAMPAEADAALFRTWVNSPAIDSGKLSSDPAAAEPIDLLVVSGHGGGGDVWGDGSGDWALIDFAAALGDNVDAPRSGRLKCVIVPSCTNVHEYNAPLWLPLFDHDDPVHLLLGYHDSYTGGSTGAYVMAKFVQAIVDNRSVSLIDAWKSANEAVKKVQPWAALVAKGAEGLNVEDWIAGKLPALSKVQDLRHFSADDPSGKDVKLIDENYDVRWVMGDGTVIDGSNNRAGDTKVGLFAGKPGKVRIKAKKADRKFKKGQEVYLFIYLYRETKKFDISDLLTFDAELLKDHPDTNTPVVTPEKGRTTRPEANNVDALRIVVPSDTDTIELGFTVKSSATTKFTGDGPGGTHGRFFLDFAFEVDRYTDPDTGREYVYGIQHSYPMIAGALLRK